MSDAKQGVLRGFAQTSSYDLWGRPSWKMTVYSHPDHEGCEPVTILPHSGESVGPFNRDWVAVLRDEARIARHNMGPGREAVLCDIADAIEKLLEADDD